MSLIECDIGDVVIIRGTLTDADGQAVAGATVTARARHDSASTEIDLGNAADEDEGVYSVQFEPTASGRWRVRLESEDPTQVAEEGVVIVRATTFSTA